MKRRAITMVVVASALVLGVQPTALANHGNAGAAGDPDDANHYMDRHNLTGFGDDAAVRGRDQLNRTQMNATFNGAGDVDIYDDFYGSTGWHGYTDCPGGINWLTGNCDVFRVRFNQSYSKTGTQWLSLGCHELGHTAGLDHRYSSDDAEDTTPSCMRSDIWPTPLDNHDIDAINGSV